MKNSVILKLITLVVLGTGTFGCKDLLTEYNPSGNTAEAVFTTPAGYESLVAGAYSYGRWWYGKEEGMALAEMGTDIWTGGSETFIATSGTAGENKPVVMYDKLGGANLNVARLWRNLYSAVNLCNRGIEISDEGKAGGSFNPDAKLVGEVKFLRAFYYWHIVETWGGVHFTTKSTKEAVLTANKTSESVFYDQIVADLNDAIAALNVTSSYGRANKWVAKAFLARVYLYRGWKFNNTADFQQAKALAIDVINNGPYDLLANYKDLWTMANEKNVESIWSVNYSTDVANTSDVYNADKNPYGYGDDILSANGNPTSNRGGNNSHTFFVPGYDRAYTAFDNTIIVRRDVRGGWPFIRFKPTKHLLSLYLDPVTQSKTKDKRYYGSWKTTWMVNSAVAKGRLVGKTPYVDTAVVVDWNPTPNPKYYTVSWDTLYKADGSSITLLTSPTQLSNQMFPGLVKFLDETRSPSPNDFTNGNIQSAKDIVVIRLAEMYLIAAEAAFKLGETNDAVTYLNLIRDRSEATAGGLDITAADVTLDFILDERAREFAGEYQRWFDLKRTGTLVSRVTTHNKDISTYIKPFHLVRPIPQVQLDAVSNKGEFTQNLGY